MADLDVDTARARGQARWRLRRTDAGLRLGVVRSFGTEAFTWADLLRVQLGSVGIYTVYFPSRFDLPVDAAATQALHTFGASVSSKTSVNFWDPTDPHFSDALALFGLRNPPALVLASGRHAQLAALDPPTTPSDVPYCICFSDPQVLGDRVRLASAVNIAHEILVRSDSREITGYIRKRKVASILALIGRSAGAVRDELVALHPTFGLPGGFSIELG